MRGSLFLLLIIFSNLVFSQIKSDSLTCSYYQDDLRLMNSLIDYHNFRLTRSDSGIIFVVINLNSDMKMEYTFGFSKNIIKRVYNEKFDSFVFGKYVVLVSTGFESPYIYSILENKKKILLSKYLLDIDYDQYDLSNNLEMFDEYKYFYVCSSSKPVIIKKTFAPFCLPCSIFKPFVEYPRIKFVNPMEKSFKKINTKNKK